MDNDIKMIVAFVLVAAVSAGSSFVCKSYCTDAERQQVSALGSHFRVTQYSGGKQVGQWESTGKVATEKGSDGWFFRDKKSGMLIRVSGDVLIEQID